MLRSLEDLERYAVTATDGDIGTVKNFLLDDERWVVRYLVVQTTGFFEGHPVLISPVSFRETDWASLRFNLALTKERVQNSPAYDSDKPFSRQLEGEFFQYYGYAPYWGYLGHWGSGAYPTQLSKKEGDVETLAHSGSASDVHLRIAREVRGYNIEGTDAPIGHVEDFIVDDETWEVRYLVIDTSNWWFGKKVLVAPQWASRISWEDKKVYVDLSRAAIQNSPEWDSCAPVNRAYETRLYDYYGRPQYWDGSDRPVWSPAPPHSASRPG